MAQYQCKCGYKTEGRFAKATMVKHIIKKHQVQSWQENESYSTYRKRYEEWIE